MIQFPCLAMMDSAMTGWMLATMNSGWLQLANAGTITVPHHGAVRQTLPDFHARSEVPIRGRALRLRTHLRGAKGHVPVP